MKKFSWVLILAVIVFCGVSGTVSAKTDDMALQSYSYISVAPMGANLGKIPVGSAFNVSFSAYCSNWNTYVLVMPKVVGLNVSPTSFVGSAMIRVSGTAPTKPGQYQYWVDLRSGDGSWGSFFINFEAY